MTEDKRLLQEYVQSGSREALEQLIRRHWGLVYSSSLRQVRDPHLAEDVLQAVFLVLTQRANTIRHDVAIGGWLLSVTRCVVITAMRKHAIQLKHERRAARPEADSAVAGQWAEIAPLLDAELNQLGRVDRDAVVLRFFQDRSFVEIGLELCLTEEAARKRVGRALERLRARLSGPRRDISAGALGAAIVLFGAQASINKAMAGTIAASIGEPAQHVAALAKGAIKMISGISTKLVAVAASLVIGTTGMVMINRTVAPRRIEAASQGPASQAARSVASNPIPAAAPAEIPLPAASTTAVSSNLADANNPADPAPPAALNRPALVGRMNGGGGSFAGIMNGGGGGSVGFPPMFQGPDSGQPGNTPVNGAMIGLGPIAGNLQNNATGIAVLLAGAVVGQQAPRDTGPRSGGQFSASSSERNNAIMAFGKLMDEGKLFASAESREAGAAGAIVAMNRVLAANEAEARTGRFSQWGVELWQTLMQIRKLALDDPAALQANQRAAAGGGADAAIANFSTAAAEYLTASGDESAQLQAADHMRRTFAAVRPIAPLGMLPQIFDDSHPATAAVANRLADFMKSAPRDLHWNFGEEHGGGPIGDMESMARRMEITGKPLTVNGPLINGANFSTSRWKGKVVLVEFGAALCPPCISNIQVLEKLYAANHNKGLELLGVWADHDPKEFKAFLAKHPQLIWPEIYSGSANKRAIGLTYGANSWPTFFLIDRKGVLREIHMGAKAELEPTIARLLAEKP